MPRRTPSDTADDPIDSRQPQRPVDPAAAREHSRLGHEVDQRRIRTLRAAVLVHHGGRRYSRMLQRLDCQHEIDVGVARRLIGAEGGIRAQEPGQPGDAVRRALLQELRLVMTAAHHDAGEREIATMPGDELQQRRVACMQVGWCFVAVLVVAADQRPVEQFVRVQQRGNKIGDVVPVEERPHQGALIPDLVYPDDSRPDRGADGQVEDVHSGRREVDGRPRE